MNKEVKMAKHMCSGRSENSLLCNYYRERVQVALDSYILALFLQLMQQVRRCDIEKSSVIRRFSDVNKAGDRCFECFDSSSEQITTLFYSQISIYELF